MKLISKYQSGGSPQKISSNQVLYNNTLYNILPSENSADYDRRNNVSISAYLPEVRVTAPAPNKNDLLYKQEKAIRYIYNLYEGYKEKAENEEEWDTRHFIKEVQPVLNYYSDIQRGLYLNPSSIDTNLENTIIKNKLLTNLEVNNRLISNMNNNGIATNTDIKYYPLSNRNQNLSNNINEGIINLGDSERNIWRNNIKYKELADNYEKLSKLVDDYVEDNYNKTLPKQYIKLRTYYPLVNKEYPLTGHSQILTDFKEISNYPFAGQNYNLVTNNCSDATRRALNTIFKKHFNPIISTPGNVRQFAIDSLGGYVSKNPFIKERGYDTVIIPITTKEQESNTKVLSNALDTTSSPLYTYIHKGYIK